MPTNISGKQFICHFREVEKIMVHFPIYLSEIQANILLPDVPKRKNLSKRWNN